MKILKNKVALLVAMMLLVMGLAGCGEKVGNDGDGAKNASGTAYPLEITDTNGETVTIKSEPQKIVSVAPNLTEVVYKLGAG
ncbi:MAG: ABC transporter substrate-binding protein, partial [Lachnospiraceae bacterium]|nr:ABC transporter substrate-binding protein [Lachnospiraceae bacterium]